jgi:hypothetical protein
MPRHVVKQLQMVDIHHGAAVSRTPPTKANLPTASFVRKFLFITSDPSPSSISHDMSCSVSIEPH